MKASCQCGELVAIVDDDTPHSLAMCHCLDCQRRSGSQFGSIAYFPEGAVEISGQAQEFTRDTDSGNTFTNGFCPICGSSVYAIASRMPATIGVMAGTFANPELGTPQRSVYEQSRHPWVGMLEDMMHYQRGSDGK